MAGVTLVKNCRLGDQVGNAKRVLYTFISDPVIDPAGTVTADLVIHPKGADSYHERRTWLCAAYAAVHVREATLADYDDETRPWENQ